MSTIRQRIKIYFHTVRWISLAQYLSTHPRSMRLSARPAFAVNTHAHEYLGASGVYDTYVLHGSMLPLRVDRRFLGYYPLALRKTM